jgi:hypothetical protein
MEPYGRWRVMELVLQTASNSCCFKMPGRMLRELDSACPLMSRVYKPTLDLLDTPLFSRQELTPAKSARRSYDRPKAIGPAHGALPR